MSSEACFLEQDAAAPDSAVVRFAGDSGDGIQVLGSQFGLANAMAGNDIATFPDYPSEVQAPAGSTYGVSAFQIQFGGRNIRTIGDAADVLVALNPAALKVNLDELKPGSLIIVDEDSFTKRFLQKAGYEESPLETGELSAFRVLRIGISKLTLAAVKDIDVTKKEAQRCKNFWALGFTFWLFHRKRAATTEWLKKKFAKKPHIAEANIAALNAGHAYGEIIEASHELNPCEIKSADMDPGTYRMVTGSQAAAWGLAAAAELCDRRLGFCSYPITPATPILHSLSHLKDVGVVTFQAEDEIAAMCSAIGVSYGGALGATATSGPGMALKTEAIGLAVMAELPVVIVNSQRAGPSTGLPTKTEQSDLYQAVYGRNGDTPVPVIAARSPADCFDACIEATRIAVTYMTPVIMLMDGFLGNAAEPWRIPDLDKMPHIDTAHNVPRDEEKPFHRNPKTLARDWVSPGRPGLEHRIGGLERDILSGAVSYDPENHQRMSQIRFDKVHNIAKDLPPLQLEQGELWDKLAVVGWGSTYGPISRAVMNMRAKGYSVAHIHLRYLHPFPTNQCKVLSTFDKLLVPEMNMGQLVSVMRDNDCPPAEGMPKVTGRPFTIAEIEAAIAARLEVETA